MKVIGCRDNDSCVTYSQGRVILRIVTAERMRGKSFEARSKADAVNGLRLCVFTQHAKETRRESKKTMVHYLKSVFSLTTKVTILAVSTEEVDSATHFLLLAYAKMSYMCLCEIMMLIKMIMMKLMYNFLV